LAHSLISSLSSLPLPAPLLSDKQKLLCCVNPEFEELPPNAHPADKQITPTQQPPEKTRKNSNKQSAQGKIKESRSGEPEGRENGDWQKAKLRSHCAADVAAFSLCSFRI